MSAHQPTPQSARARIALVSALALGLAAIPLALGVPAQAVDNYAGTITAQSPEYSHHTEAAVQVLNDKDPSQEGTDGYRRP